jgi:ferredoxin-type protein NapF
VGDRREFFRKLTKPLSDIKEEPKPLYVRPPYAKDLSLFDKECINCESKLCAKVCDEKIIVIEASGTPIINFTKSGCTFCQDCAEACELGVLSLDEGKESINATFLINKDKCMAHNGSVCFSCKEPCIDDAILFKGMFEPIIDIQKCTSCGFCLSRCPTNAIEYIIK